MPAHLPTRNIPTWPRCHRRPHHFKDCVIERKIRPALVHFALSIGGFAIGTTEFATMSLLRYFAHDLRIDEPTAGHVISAYALGVVIGAPIIAVLSARLGRRTLLIVLMSLFALANGLSGLAPSYEWLLFFRFLSGLPHGAYFGIAALVAASLVPPEKRTMAVGRVLLGLTVATIIGVPAANWLGQAVGWRWGFAVVMALALTCAVMVWIFAPADRPSATASPLRELSALRSGQVWLTLGAGAVGFFGIWYRDDRGQLACAEVCGPGGRRFKRYARDAKQSIQPTIGQRN